jgi:hypothetical protein
MNGHSPVHITWHCTLSHPYDMWIHAAPGIWHVITQSPRHMTHQYTLPHLYYTSIHAPPAIWHVNTRSPTHMTCHYTLPHACDTSICTPPGIWHVLTSLPHCNLTSQSLPLPCHTSSLTHLCSQAYATVPDPLVTHSHPCDTPEDPLLNVSYQFLQVIVLWVIIGLYIGWAL